MTTLFASRLFVSLSEGSSWSRRRTIIPASNFTPRAVWEMLGKAIKAKGRNGWTAVILAVDESQWVTDSIRSLNSFAGSIFSLMTSDEVVAGTDPKPSIAVQNQTWIIPVRIPSNINKYFRKFKYITGAFRYCQLGTTETVQ